MKEDSMCNKRVLASWSSGKDSAWMLHVLKASPECEVIGLVTTFTETTNRVAMHNVQRSLVMAQADAVGLPLFPVMLPPSCSNAEYERRLRQAIEQARPLGVTHIAFGDLFLQDIRDYRVRLLAGTGCEPLFPIWTGSSATASLAHQMISSGLRSVLTCVDTSVLPASFAGREFDLQLLSELPASVDPCGENGEFHTFCYAGPHQKAPLQVDLGDRHSSENFAFVQVALGSGKGAQAKDAPARIAE
jgi:uncharacterized protein (TIGR00290 family)